VNYLRASLWKQSEGQHASSLLSNFQPQHKNKLSPLSNKFPTISSAMTNDSMKLTPAQPLSNRRSSPYIPLQNSKSDLYEAPPTSKFVDLPPEIHVLLFSYFDRCTSTCLGLTSKYFYATHRWGEAGSYLTDSCEIPNPISRWCPKTIYLYELLREWMGPEMRYVAEEQKFWNVLRVVEMEKRKALEKEQREALKKERREAEKRTIKENMQRECEVCGQMG
jgi:hypothetical protein